MPIKDYNLNPGAYSQDVASMNAADNLYTENAGRLANLAFQSSRLNSKQLPDLAELGRKRRNANPTQDAFTQNAMTGVARQVGVPTQDLVSSTGGIFGKSFSQGY